MIRELVASKDHQRVHDILEQLCNDYAYAVNQPHARNGGLIGLAAAAIALGPVSRDMDSCPSIIEGDILLADLSGAKGSFCARCHLGHMHICLSGTPSTQFLLVAMLTRISRNFRGTLQRLFHQYWLASQIKMLVSGITPVRPCTILQR